MFRLTQIAFIISALIAGVSMAEIINVPEDYETIQGGIDASEDGDTILVAAGEYVENINFDGKAIVVMGNPEDPSEVVIDGDQNGQSVIVFRDEADGNSVLAGFTIQNGTTDYGGGIYITGASPTLVNLRINNNRADRSGGGIYATEESQAQIIDCYIYENSATAAGGGITSYTNTELLIRNCIISGNVAGARGGGVSIGENGNAIIERCLITGNSSDYGAGVLTVGMATLINCTIADNIRPRVETNHGLYVQDGLMSLSNCIVWFDHIRVVHGEIVIEYSILPDGADSVNPDGGEFDDGDGNIGGDPMFLDPENGNYELHPESPCIDAGNPDGEADADGSRADMGVFSYLGTMILKGYVFDEMSGNPIDSVEVSTSYGAITYTDSTGFYRFPWMREPSFDLTASIIEYSDSTILEIEMEPNDTLEINFRLLHAELEPSIEGITTEILEHENEQFDFSISNPGNGVLDWSVEMRYRGEAGHDPWELRQSHHFGEQLDDDRLQGVAYINNKFYIAGANRFEENGNVNYSLTMYVLDSEGALIDTFAQPGEGRSGMQDLTWDGEWIWGCEDDTVYALSLAGEVMASFEAPYSNSKAITWDPDHEVLWICNVVTNPVAVDRQGNLIEGMEIDRDGRRIYGLAYFAEDGDNAPLYMYYKDIDVNRSALAKYNLDNEEYIFLTYLSQEGNRTLQGLYITNTIDHYSWVFMSVRNVSVNDGSDQVDIWQLEANTSWAQLDPIAGSLDPAAEQEMTLIIDATDLAPIDYPAELRFSQNGFGLETTIPIDLTVTSLDVDDLRDITAPTEYGISDVFPNPFNSTVRLKYTVPRLSNVSIKLYDITGSLVEIVTNELHEYGLHSVTWNASTMPSGIYFARMESGEISQTVKLMLMK